MDLQPELKSISMHLRHHFKYLRDAIGMNVQALKILGKEISTQIAGGNFLDFKPP